MKAIYLKLDSKKIPKRLKGTIKNECVRTNQNEDTFLKNLLLKTLGSDDENFSKIFKKKKERKQNGKAI